MSLSLTMYNALTALSVNQRALTLTSNNIANLNTPGYSRKTQQQLAVVLAGQGAGVETGTIQRQVDEFLLRDLRAQTTKVGYADVRAEFFNRMQEMFGSLNSDNAIANDITDLSTAIEQLASNPETAAQRFIVANEAASLAARFRDMADAVQSSRKQADIQIADAVDLINTQLQIIADLNPKIALNKVQGLPTGELEDARDLALEKISENLDVQSFNNGDGQITVLTGSGRTLVAGATAGTLAYDASALMTAQRSYPATISGIYLNGGATPPPTSDITLELQSGRLAALVEMRDRHLPSMTNQLDQLAAALRDAVNRAHNRGANTPLGLGAAAGDPATMTGSRTIANPAAAVDLQHSVTMAILDASGNTAVAPVTIAAGVTTADAIRAAIDAYVATTPGGGSATWNADDQMEIRLASGYRLAFLDNGPAADSGDATILFDADGDTVNETYNGLSNFFGLNDLFRTPQLAGGGYSTLNDGAQLGISSTIEVRPDIVANPDYLSRGILRGTVPNLTLGVGDNLIVQQMAETFAQNIAFPAVTDGPSSTTTTLGGYATTILSFNATATAAADATQQFENDLKTGLNDKALSVSGVNIDEELSNMIIFQNAYNAAARVIQTANELYDELLQIA